MRCICRWLSNSLGLELKQKDIDVDQLWRARRRNRDEYLKRPDWDGA